MIGFLDRLLLRNFDEAGRAFAEQLTGRAIRSIIATFTLAGTISFIAVAFRDLVLPWLLNAWLAAMAVVTIGPLALTIAFALHGPGSIGATRPYVVLSQILTFALSALIAASIWILLPAASLPLQFVMIVLYVTFVAMMLGADTGLAVTVAQLAVMASAIAFVLVYRLPYAVPLAIVLSAVAISLAGLHRLTTRSTQAAVVARQEAERANAALKVALAEIAAERDAKTRFIAAASHDLRQPVQAAALYFEHALSGADMRLRERAVAGARRAFASVETLLESMLQYLRFEAGGVSAHIEPVELDALFGAVVDQQRLSAAEAGVRLVAVRSGQWVSGDAAILQRVLNNLVGNAIRHSGGRRVLVGARRRGGVSTIWVIDDGRGVADADVARLFEDYVQGGAGAQGVGGFGIGLSSSKRMMESMAGVIALDRRWRRGAAFRLELPVAAWATEARLCKAV